MTQAVLLRMKRPPWMIERSAVSTQHSGVAMSMYWQVS
jgi:hypothetical protein